MSSAVSAVYLIALCVCGWRVVYRIVARRRRAYRSFDTLLWLSGTLLVLIPIVTDSTNAAGWSDPDILDPTLVSVGWVVALLAWDLWTAWTTRSRAHDTGESVGAEASRDR